jgi:TonB family protein
MTHRRRPAVLAFTAALALGCAAAPAAAEVTSRPAGRVAAKQPAGARESGLTVGNVRVDGPLAVGAAQASLERGLSKLRPCWPADKATSLGPEVDLRLLVRPDGKAAGATVERQTGPEDAKLRRCVQRVALGFTFDTTRGANHSTVRATIAPHVSAEKLLRIIGTLGDIGGGALADVLSGGDLGSVAEALRPPVGSGLAAPGTGGEGNGGGGLGILRPSPGGAPGNAPPAPAAAKAPPPSRARVDFGAPEIGAGLDRAHVDPVITRARAGFLACYERRLAAAPTLAGRVVVRLTVDAGGRAVDPTVVSTSLGDVEVQRCLVERFARLRFPAPSRPGVSVTQPLVFRVVAP